MKLTKTLTPEEIQAGMAAEDPWEKEMDAANAFIEEHPGSAEGYMTRARLYDDDGDYASAMVDADKAVELAPDSPEAHAIRGGLFRSYYFRDRDEEHRECAIAMELLSREHVVRLTPRETDEKSAAELAAIIEQATRDVRNKDNRYDALIRRARAYDELRDVKKRNRDVTKAISLDPMQPEAYIARAAFRMLDEHDTRIKEDVEKAYKLDPTRSEGYLTLGRRYFHAGADLSVYALEAIEKAISIDKNCAEAYYYRGRIRFNRDQYKKALADFRRAAKLDPGFAQAYLALAECAEGLGLFDVAVEAYNKYVRNADKMEVLSVIDAIERVEKIRAEM